MTRKALEAFDPAKLRNSHSASFETRNPKTGYSEHHYFYRDSDGELFTMVDHRRDVCEEARKKWQKLKRAKLEELKQIDFMQLEPPEDALAESELSNDEMDDMTEAESDFSDEYTKRCGWCLEMNKESSSFCWACEGEI